MFEQAYCIVNLEEIAALNLAKYRKAQSDLGMWTKATNKDRIKINICYSNLQKIQLNVLMLLKIN